ncbi:PREDICTED: melanoma-associated antigen B16-like [Chrysochloris asiatica]|uniref:Melanoma-associated antigen B16-like n=1 Tax=Chrysochloris asiatica TaxID=185453 RepID=A0A9B0TRR8_CHRAS|nr:PREDICTED: melanoma-associated antigen B16-like [Chrysochloris asiatica]
MEDARPCQQPWKTPEVFAWEDRRHFPRLPLEKSLTYEPLATRLVHRKSFLPDTGGSHGCGLAFPSLLTPPIQVIMPAEKESPRIPPEENLHIFSEAEGLDDMFFDDIVEETSSSSSYSPNPIYEEDALNEYASSPTLMITTERSDEDASNQEDEDKASNLQSLPGSDNLLKNPIDEKVAILVNFLLLKYQKKEPITKADMLNAVIQEYEDYFSEILLKTCERMEIVFGLDVTEVDPINNCYALLIKLNITYDGMLSETEGMPKTGILILLLGVIFMKGNRATEEEVWQVLNMMGIHAGQKHFIFGEPKNLITNELVKEKYVEYRQLPGSDPACYEFVWGPRANAEVSKMKLLEFLSRVHGRDPRSLPVQYDEALKEEEERAQAKAEASPESTNMAVENSSATSSSCSHP